MNKIKILVVDDEKHVCALLHKALTKAGYKVYTCNNATDAFEMIQSTPVDLIISDIKMDGTSGIEFLHQVKAFDYSIGFILITAFATTETAIDALKNGAQDYVTKPFDIHEILHAVEKIALPIQKGYEQTETEGSVSVLTKTNSKNQKMQDLYTLAKRVANSDSTVLITGDTGTGKEVLATAIHNWSPRNQHPLIKINCAAIPDNLLESELFGYEKGAFTGANTSKSGRLELAQGGTVFLDEIGDISPSLQVRLLRFLQEKTYEPLGGLTSISADVRIITATNKNLKDAVYEGTFREDLYYRLNVVPFKIPPLRERPEDLEYLINYFLKKSASISGNQAQKQFSPTALNCLKQYAWPGNIRELENIIERCVVITSGQLINSDSLPSEINCIDHTFPESLIEKNKDEQLNDVLYTKEKEVILATMKTHQGNRTKTALTLGISRRSLHRKLQKYHIE